MRELYKKFGGYLRNITWILGDRFLAILIGFLVAVMLARYLGPGQYGILSYGLSITALTGAIAHFGLSGLVVKRLVECSDNQHKSELLGTTFGLRFIGALLGYITAVVYTVCAEGLESQEFLIVSIVGLVLFYRAFDVVEIWFKAVVKARYATIPKVIALLSGAILKAAAVVFGAGIVYVAVAHAIQFLIAAILLTLSYGYANSLKMREWKFSFNRGIELISAGWMIYLGSIFAVIYLKLDQVMLKAMVDSQAVGTYAVAAQISEAWYVLPAAIVTTFFPRLIKLRAESESQFRIKLQQLLDMLFAIALIVAVIITFIAEPLIASLFGPAYEASASILVIHIWAALFIFLRAAFSKWILIENVYIYSVVTQGSGAIINILLNLVLIPAYGGKGAAIATLISYSVSSYISLFFFAKTRAVFWQMTLSFLSPLRYSFGMFGGKKLMKFG